MTDNDTEQFDETTAEPVPFLTITGAWPAPEGRTSTLGLSMYLADEEVLGGDDGPGAWLANFCTEVIGALRASTTGPSPEPQIVIHNDSQTRLPRQSSGDQDGDA